MKPVVKMLVAMPPINEIWMWSIVEETCQSVTQSDSSDPRSLQKTDLFALVEQVVSLREVQRRIMNEVLVKYLSHMTTKPGRCNLFSYKFQVNADKPIVGYCRTIPFTTQPAVREQINQMLRVVY
jgi:hypothetical protein